MALHEELPRELTVGKHSDDVQIEATSQQIPMTWCFCACRNLLYA